VKGGRGEKCFDGKFGKPFLEKILNQKIYPFTLN
jgi:hypothetical protein